MRAISFRRALAGACMAVALTGCASTYVDADSTWTGGFEVEKVSGDIWSVGYYGNGYTTNETVLAYWLYRTSELALAEGYDGFKIGSSGSIQNLIDEGWSGKPQLDARVRLLKAPLEEDPGVVFNASALKAFLEPYVKGKKCDGNVCPHVREYLYPGFGATAPS